MDQTQMDALIASIQGTAPVPNQPLVYARNPIQVDSSNIIDYGSAVGIKRYRYATAALSLTVLCADRKTVTMCWVTAADSILMCSINALIDSWVTFGFVVDGAQALMESLGENFLK